MSIAVRTGAQESTKEFFNTLDRFWYSNSTRVIQPSYLVAEGFSGVRVNRACSSL